MQLIRLALENWRGIRSRTLEFSAGITLIEGPNEAGKSSLIEALKLLLTEPDSSKKKQIKNIQPVSQDVGSSVLAELRVGDVHCTLSKTFNRATQTLLQIHAPAAQQFTGREAHDQARALLTEHVDLALWDALLVDQGASVGPKDSQVSINDSLSLSRALDQVAAGTDASSADASRTDAAPPRVAAGEDSQIASLFEAAREEYERYFTARTGTIRFQAQRQAVADAIAAEQAATAQQDALTQDQLLHERLAQGIRQQARLLPGLEAREQALRTQHERLLSLADELKQHQAQVANATRLHDTVRQLVKDRAQMQQQIRDEQQQLTQLRADGAAVAERLEPLTARRDALRQAVEAARERVALTSARVLQQERAQRLRAAEQEHAATSDRLTQLEALEASRLAQQAAIADLRITNKDVDALRQALALRDRADDRLHDAGVELTVKAIQPLTLQLNDETINVAPEAPLQHRITRALTLNIDQRAELTLHPAAAIEDLAEQSAAANRAWETLCATHGVRDLAQAVGLAQARIEATQQLERIRLQQAGLLQGSTAEALRDRLIQLTAEREHLRQRLAPVSASPSSDPVQQQKPVQPALTQPAAQPQQQSAESAAAAASRELKQLDTELQAANEVLAELEAEQRAQQRQQDNATARITQQRETLGRHQDREPDADLAARLQQAKAQLDAQTALRRNLERQLSATQLDDARLLLENATAALKRAQQAQGDQLRDLAIVADRLSRARADGRFETAIAAEQQRDNLQQELARIERQAAAARTLWDVLNRQRDASRVAYVAPLKQAVERFGRVVFGPDLHITLSDDWQIETRTLNGQTLAYSELSIGAQEQLSILLRLAAAELVAGDGGIPLFLDDALGFADAERLAAMGDAIALAGQRCQIIILTCYPDRFAQLGSARVLRLDPQDTPAYAT